MSDSIWQRKLPELPEINHIFKVSLFSIYPKGLYCLDYRWCTKTIPFISTSPLERSFSFGYVGITKSAANIASEHDLCCFKESGIVLHLGFIWDSEQELCNHHGWKCGKPNKHDVHVTPTNFTIFLLLSHGSKLKMSSHRKNSSLSDILPCFQSKFIYDICKILYL